MKKLILLLSLFSLNSYGTPDVIYGEDNRIDVFETTNPEYQKFAASTLARVEMNELKGWKFFKLWELKKPKTLKDMNLCSDEKFLDQPTIAGCTAFLVSPKHIVTAGHCISDHTCRSNLYYWFFDYHMPEDGEFQVKRPREDFVSCKKVVKRVFSKATGEDYALIELKKEVKNRTPLKFRREGTASVGDELVIIGHPSGLPTKIADGAKVKEVNEYFLTANLDAFGGNSGSPVINTRTGEVEGILVRGQKDYRWDQIKFCNRSNRLQDEAAGESVTNITRIQELMNL